MSIDGGRHAVFIKLHLESGFGRFARRRIQNDGRPIAKEIVKNLEIAIAKFSPRMWGEKLAWETAARMAVV
jgi:hypothetical protein